MTTCRSEDKCTCIENLLRATYTYLILTAALWNQYAYLSPRSDSCDSEKLSKSPKVIKQVVEQKQSLSSPWSATGSGGTRAADEWDTGPMFLPEEASQEMACCVLCTGVSLDLCSIVKLAFPDSFLAQKAVAYQHKSCRIWLLEYGQNAAPRVSFFVSPVCTDDKSQNTCKNHFYEFLQKPF